MSRGSTIWLLVCLSLACVPFARAAEELLPVDHAFVLTANAAGHERIDVHWQIADGYYLYRHRTSVRVLDGGFAAEALQLPDGTRHVDEFFGEVETYRQALSARLPGRASAASVQLEIRYQGCADLGVCYPPQTRTLSVALPLSSADGLAALGRVLGRGLPAIAPGPGHSPLPPEQAFGFEAIAEDGQTLLLRFTPAPGYYLYQERMAFRLDGADGISPGAPRWPPARAYHDAHFGEVEVYFDQIDVPLPVLRQRAEAVTATLTATFQGCQDQGICYPPITRVVDVALPEVRADAAADNLHRSTPPPAVSGLDAPSLLFTLGLALTGGLVLNLMPCVLPVLSLKVLGLARSGESRAHARRSALWYSAGVLVAFG